MKKHALLFYSQITHRAAPDTPRVVGTAPKSGLLPAIAAAILFLLLILYFLAAAVGR